MDAKSKLEKARNYEYSAMMARAQNETVSANRYESMARMATIDAGIDLTNMNVSAPISSGCGSSSYANAPTEKWDELSAKKKIGAIASFIITVAFLIGIFIMGSYM